MKGEMKCQAFIGLYTVCVPLVSLFTSNITLYMFQDLSIKVRYSSLEMLKMTQPAPPMKKIEWKSSTFREMHLFEFLSRIS